MYSLPIMHVPTLIMEMRVSPVDKDFLAHGGGDNLRSSPSSCHDIEVIAYVRGLSEARDMLQPVHGLVQYHKRRETARTAAIYIDPVSV
jgi:hypothetical protein